MLYRTLLFDLDDTLYPHQTGLWEAIRLRMDKYMHQRLGLSLEAIPDLRKYYLETYGTTLRGLQMNNHVDAQDFLAYVHDLPVRRYLQPNPLLRQMLLSLPQKRFVFTNADQPHALRVLSALGLDDCFYGIIDVNALEFIPKPDAQAYWRALQLAEANVETTMIFDDAPRNLAPARELGLTTVLVSPEPEAEFDYYLPNLEDLPKAVPGLWNSQPK